jgi:hypothetical protein
MSPDEVDTDDIEASEAALKAWDAKDPSGAFEFLKARWAYADWGWSEKDGEDGERIYEISTAGWSDNEALMYALRRNRFFWFFHWYSERRGGHYEFRVRSNFRARTTPQEGDR